MATTVRELRNVLFDVEDQNLTVRELRDRLFSVQAQDAEVSTRLLRIITN